MREFRQKLSQYLRDVEHGETVLVTAHGHVIAEVKPPGKASELELSREEREAREMLAAGVFSRLGTQDETDWPEPPEHGVPLEDVEAALRATRKDKG